MTGKPGGRGGLMGRLGGGRRPMSLKEGMSGSQDYRSPKRTLQTGTLLGT